MKALPFVLVFLAITAQAQPIEISLKGAPDEAISNGFYFVPADLDGDGQIDFVTSRSKGLHDPHYKLWEESEGEVVLQAHRQDGELLWTFPLGLGIEEGLHYSPFTAYDVDGDGKDEVYAKIAEDEFGEFPNRVYSNKEWLVKIDPATGKELKRVPWFERWDEPGEIMRPYSGSSRNMLIIAYVDGVNPFVVIQRGTYDKNGLLVYDKDLNLHWRWECENEANPNFCGSSAHGTFSADIDADGRDEIILGSAAVDDDGKGMWAILPGKFGHVDMSFTGDLDWDNPGMETFLGAEKVDFTGIVDSRTGRVLWKKELKFQGFGACGDIDLRYPGLECTGEADIGLHGGGGRRLFTAKGVDLDPTAYGLPTEPANTSREQVAWWDGTEQSSVILFGGSSTADPLLVPMAAGYCFTADVMGDWREEILYSFENKIIIHTASGEPALKLPNLWTDRKYRTDRARGYLGSGYFTRPLPSKRLTELGTEIGMGDVH